MPNAGGGGTERTSAPRSHVKVDVTGDQLLVVETVAAALRANGLDARPMPWPRPGSATPAERAGVGIVVALVDLGQPDQIEVLLSMVRASRSRRWLVLTSTPAGALWTAVLDAGVDLVLEQTTAVADVLAAISLIAPEGGRTAPGNGPTPGRDGAGT